MYMVMAQLVVTMSEVVLGYVVWVVGSNNYSIYWHRLFSIVQKSCDDGLYPNVKTVLKIASTFPVTSCECERSISTLGLVKTKLRSTMGQERLTGLCLLSRHRDIKVDAREVVLKFARMHPRRMTFPNVLADSE